MPTSLALAVDGGSKGFPPARELHDWLQGLELDALVPGRCTQAPDARALRSALPGIRIPAVRGLFSSAGRLASHEVFLGHAEPARRARSLEELLASARQAEALGASLLILDLHLPAATEPESSEAGAMAPVAWMDLAPDQELELLCRSLHQLLRQGPAVGLALATPGPSEPRVSLEMVEAVLEDLVRHPVHYWHDSGRAHAREKDGKEPSGEWLQRLGSRCAGADLTDAVGTLHGLPAGAGELDWVAVRESLPSTALRVVRAEPFPGPGPLAEAVRHLRGLGL